jgi:hypothetical protein
MTRQKIKTKHISVAMSEKLFNFITNKHMEHIKRVGLPISMSEFICGFLEEKMMGEENKGKI